MPKPYWKWICILNPPTDFAAHEEAIRQQAGLIDDVEVVGVRYGYGPCAELTLDIDYRAGGGGAVVAFLDALRTNPETRLIAIDGNIDLTAAERDELGGEPPLEKWST